MMNTKTIDWLFLAIMLCFVVILLTYRLPQVKESANDRVQILQDSILYYEHKQVRYEHQISVIKDSMNALAKNIATKEEIINKIKNEKKPRINPDTLSGSDIERYLSERYK
jgi:hypothetical protein